MAEYIEREALIADINKDAERVGADCPWDITAIETAIEAQPAADVAPVVHGRWELYMFGKELMCSACKTTFWDEGGSSGSNYCPHCGAKMDLK